MNDKIKNRIIKLKNDKKVILKYIDVFKNNEKAKELFKDNEDFIKLNENKQNIDD